MAVEKGRILEPFVSIKPLAYQNFDGQHVETKALYSGPSYRLVPSLEGRTAHEGPQILLSWSSPELGWKEVYEIKLLRKELDLPRNHLDGTLIYHGDGEDGKLSDLNVNDATWYYYKLFALTNFGWIASAKSSVIVYAVSTSYFKDWMYKMLPALYRVKDREVGDGKILTKAVEGETKEVLNFNESQTEKQFTLQRFLKNFALEFDVLKKKIESYPDIYRLEKVSGLFIAYLANLLGLELPERGYNWQRNELKRWSFFLRRKGMIEFIKLVIEQTIGLVPTIIEMRERLFREGRSHTWNPRWTTSKGRVDDVHDSITGFDSSYNLRGLRAYVEGYPTEEQWSLLLYRLKEILPGSVKFILFANEIEKIKLNI
jgi:hypothetical protein